MSFTIENEEIINLLDNCNNYIENHKKLDELLSNGWINLSKARNNNNISYNTTDNMRFDIDPSILIDISTDNIITKIEPSEIADYQSGLLLVSPLPNYTLRKSYNNFKLAIDLIITLANQSILINNQVVDNDNIDLE